MISGSKSKIYFIICLLLSGVALAFFPLHRILTNENADNPHHSSYYITLQAVLANYPLLAYDAANIRFIKHRLARFENDTSGASALNKITKYYRQQYQKVLNQYHVRSINDVDNQNKIFHIAKESSTIIDHYYLDKRLFEINPLYFPGEHDSRRILRYNFAGVYGQLPSRYLRALVAMPTDSQTGVFSGFFVNNGSTTLTTQFITGMPILTALYVMPEHNFADVGSYQVPVPWNYFRPNIIMSPRARKVMDVGGIDLFSFSKSDSQFALVSSIPALSPIITPLYPMFGGNEVRTYINERSYGMAYLANQIIYQDPGLIRHDEKVIKRYFGNVYNRHPQPFLAATHHLYDMLMALPHRYDVILEKKRASSFSTLPAGKVKIENIVGERALFNTNCLRTQCTLVANISAAPGWYAFVNGEQTQIQRANFAFMAVNVPKGKSRVWFIYSPYSESICYFLSIFTLISVFVLSFNRKKIMFLHTQPIDK